MESNPKIDVVGSSITEFYDDGAMKELFIRQSIQEYLLNLHTKQHCLTFQHFRSSF